MHEGPEDVDAVYVWGVSVDAYVLYDAVWALYSIHSFFLWTNTVLLTERITYSDLPISIFPKFPISSSGVTKFVEIEDRARWPMSIPHVARPRADT